MRVSLLTVEPLAELRWLGGTWSPGLLDGDHRFLIDEVAPGVIRVTQREEFHGLLVLFLAHRLVPTMQAAFVLMNQALKRRVERCSPRLGASPIERTQGATYCAE